MQNTIILWRGYAELTQKEYKNFSQLDTILGDDRDPEELKRWPIEQKAEALEELKKYKCHVSEGVATYAIEEYALEFCQCNDEGEFIEGGDYEPAETI